MTGETILAVGAHPDDIEIFCGGTLARLARQGRKVVSLMATRGDKGSKQASQDPDAVTRIRAEEARRSADILQIHETVQLGHPDGGLDQASGLRGGLVAAIRRYQPTAVFCFDPWKPYELHPDHRAVGFATLDARLFAKHPLYFPEQIAEGLTPWEVSEIYLFNTHNANVWFDIGPTLQTKLAAVRQHRSQFPGPLGDDLERVIIEEARICGPRAGGEYAEGFKHIVMREVAVFSSLRESALPDEWV